MPRHRQRTKQRTECTLCKATPKNLTHHLFTVHNLKAEEVIAITEPLELPANHQ